MEQRFANCIEMTENVAGLDMKSLLSMHILIVPSATKHANENALQSDCLIKLSADEFLTVFQSLFVEYEKEEITALESATNRRNSSNGLGTTETDTVVASRPTFSKENTRSVETQTSNAKAVSQFSGKAVKSCEKAVTDASTQTFNGETPQISTASNYLCSYCRTIESQKANKSVEVNFGHNIKKNKDEADTNIREEDLKKALLAAHCNVRSIHLDYYLKDWNSSEEVSRLPSSKYLQLHISLLADFLSEGKVHDRFHAKLLQRYIFYLKRLTALFQKNDSESVIKFDQLIITKARKIGGWNFTKAWHQAEDEKKENSYRQTSSSEINIKRNLVEDANAAKTCPQQIVASTLRKRSLSPRLPHNENDLSSRLFSRLSSDNRSIEVIATRQVQRVSREKSRLPRTPAKRQRSNLSLYERVGALKSNASLAERMLRRTTRSNVELDPQARTFCKYFNTGFCFKSASDCSFLHACNVCSKSSHGQKNCPNL